MTRLGFVRAHPAPHGPVEKAAFFLEQLCRPAAVIEKKREGRLALLAVVIDTCDNVEDEASLEVLGLDSSVSDDALLMETLDTAHSIALAGPRTRLSVGMPGAFPERLLLEAGFAAAYHSYEMERPHEEPAPVETPSGMRWIDADRSWAEALDRALRPAMASVPGSFAPPFEVFAARLEVQPIPTRMLVEGERVAAFVRPEVQGDRGFIGILGRAPWARGRGLGTVALREGVRLLAGLGCGRIGLEVNARNEAALRLYRAEGFGVVGRTTTLSLRLR